MTIRTLKWLTFAGTLLLPSLTGCQTAKATRPFQPPPPTWVTPAALNYADTDAFDSLMETALNNQTPVITVRTNQSDPEWEGRLNAWVAAWNKGGKVDYPVEQTHDKKAGFFSAVVGSAKGDCACSGSSSVGASPLRVDGDLLRESRLLLDSVCDRCERYAKGAAGWWEQEKVASHRVDLLKPYNMSFKKDEEGTL